MTGIYVVRVGADRLKVGKSVDVVKRAAQIRSATGLAVEFVGVLACRESRLWQAERDALTHMSPFVINGEWHTYSPQSVAAALQVVNPFDRPMNPVRSAERRSQVYQFRLNPVEHRILHDRAESEQKTVADFIRERVFA